MLSMAETDRYAVILRVMGKTLTQSAAALELKLSVRQVKRLCAAVRKEGAKALASKKRGLPSRRRILDAPRARFVALVISHYSDFGPQLAWEYLKRDHGFSYSVETLRGWMTQAGLWQPKQRRAKRVHPSRPRRPRLGELVQIDGSHHDWFEGRGEKCCLIAFIDDATSQVLAARFFAQETTVGYLGLVHQHVHTQGRPLAYYSDRHGIFTKPDPEDAKPTQFERALLQLGIDGIQARTPQAKGRVERLFQTLQDRMCKAMRLAGISDMAAANAWLPDFISAHNKQFGVPAAQPDDAHRAYPGTPQELARICAVHETRQLNRALNCRFEGQVLQVHPKQEGQPKDSAQVDIVKHLDGTLELLYRQQSLAFTRYDWAGYVKAAAHDDKTINAHVQQIVCKEDRRIAQLRAQLDHERDQRTQGIFYPNSHPNAQPKHPHRAPART
jgi:transposase